MGGTWLVRGAAGAVVAVLAGAWAVGVAGQGDETRPPGQESPTPSSPDTSSPPENERSVDSKKVKPPRLRDVAESPDPVTEPTPDTDVEPTDDAPSTPVPTSPEPTPDEPSIDPPPPPPPGPSDPPSEPSDECTDLLGDLDCVLNPITAQP